MKLKDILHVQLHQVSTNFDSYISRAKQGRKSTCVWKSNMANKGEATKVEDVKSEAKEVTKVKRIHLEPVQKVLSGL